MKGAKMRGFAMLEPNKVGWVEKKDPEFSPLDAVLRPIAVMPCTTDVHSVWEGLVPELAEPLIIGHEGVGEVVKVGSLVNDFKVGDIVIVPSLTPNYNHVDSQKGVPAHCGGFLGGFNLASTDDGCFAEYYVIRNADSNLALLPDGIKPEEGAFCSDMIATGFRGVLGADVGFGDTVCVIGIGPVGLMAIAGSKMRGASNIFGVGSRPVCVDAARYYGAEKTFNYKEGNIVDQIMDYTGGKPVDKVIITGGNADTYAQGLEIVKCGGIVSNVAFLSNRYGDIKIPMNLFGGGIADKQIRGYTALGGRAWMEAFARLLKSGALDVKPLITHRFEGLDRCEDALYLMRDKPADLIKPVVNI